MGKYDAGFQGDKSNSMRVEGIDSLLDSFKALPGIVTIRHLERAMQRAVKPMENELRSLTPQGPTGNLLKAVSSRVQRYGGSKNGMVFGIVGYKRAVSQPTGDTKGYHSSWIETGTNDRVPKASKILSSLALSASYTPPGWRFTWPMVTKRAKGIRGYHPLGRAYSATANACRDILTAELEVALDRAIDEARQKGLD